eukprot:364788-Chlamydomonas_euryale.AAC.2
MQCKAFLMTWEDGRQTLCSYAGTCVRHLCEALSIWADPCTSGGTQRGTQAACMPPLHACHRSVHATAPCMPPLHACHRSVHATSPCMSPLHACHRSVHATAPCMPPLLACHPTPPSLAHHPVRGLTCPSAILGRPKRINPRLVNPRAAVRCDQSLPSLPAWMVGLQGLRKGACALHCYLGGAGPGWFSKRSC